MTSYAYCPRRRTIIASNGRREVVIHPDLARDAIAYLSGGNETAKTMREQLIEALRQHG